MQINSKKTTDHIAALTSDAVAARLAGIKAASEALGHATTAMTEKHYLSGEHPADR